MLKEARRKGGAIVSAPNRLPQAVIALDHRKVIVSVIDQPSKKFLEIHLVSDAGGINLTDRTLQMAGIELRRAFNTGCSWVRVGREVFGRLQDAALKQTISPVQS